MRPPSRFALPFLCATLVALAAAGSASADTAAESTSIDAARLPTITNDAFDEACESMISRVDERLSMALSGPTTMDCEKSAESGLETCVVRTAGRVAGAPAALAHN